MPRVALFVTCIVDQLFPQAGLAMATVLERLGYEVDFPEDQTCCGQPAFNSGYVDEARAVAAGMHALDPAWRRHFRSFYASCKFVDVGRFGVRAAKSDSTLYAVTAEVLLILRSLQQNITGIVHRKIKFATRLQVQCISDLFRDGDLPFDGQGRCHISYFLTLF